MDTQEIYDRVVKVTAEVLNIDRGMIEPDSNFIFDLGAESTQSVQLVAAFEQEFDIEMDNEAALQVQTVAAAAEFIGKYANK